MRRVSVWLVLILLFSIAPFSVAFAQGPCGTVDAIDFPLDPENYSMIYGYNIPSSRHDGRLHAGEDWVGSITGTYGAPVRAVARGRITYSAPLGWGRDKGVVIIEHIMPDGTLWYSFYGHLEEFEDDGIRFPAVFTCVDRGDVVGGIGRPRPAPHLHFEIRNFWPDSPGPGYWGTDPTLQGWRRPSKFIYNWQTWLSPAYRWHADIADESGPVWPAIIREDSALLLFDADRLVALNPTGQVLWRYIMDEEFDIVGTLPYGDNVMVAGRDGALQLWSQTGGYVETWQLPHEVDGPPYLWNDVLVTHTPDDDLVAYGPDRLEHWRVAGVTRPRDMQSTTQLLAVSSIYNSMTFISPDGMMVNQATLRRAGSLAPAPDGGIYVRSVYGLWRVSVEGVWQLLSDAPPVQFSGNSFHSLPDGRFFVYDGSRDRTLHAYAGQGAALWSVELAELEGAPFFLDDGGGTLVLVDSYGHALALNAGSGAVCNQIRAWGWRSSDAWAGLGPDGILRLHIADQVLGLDWATFVAGCQ